MSEGNELKKTPLYDEHVQLGARVIDFGGWAMPVQYSGIIEEHTAVRAKAGLFDVSHMGEVNVTGPGAMDFVNHLVTNDVSQLELNQALYTPMCYEDGGIIDDLLVYKLADERYFLVINAGNTDKDYAWIEKVAADWDDVTVENVSPQWAQLAIQGPLAQEILQALVDTDLSDIQYFWTRQNVDVAGARSLVSRTGYTGEDGFEIYAPAEHGPGIWRALLDTGADRGLQPAGLGARDTLRFEACLPLYGNDLDEDTNPLEARLSYFVKLDKDEFIGKEALARAREEGLKKRLVGFELIDRGIPRHGYAIYDADGEQEIGVVTSGAPAPTLGKNLGMGYVPPAYAKRGTDITIELRGRKLKARTVRMPFYRRPQ